MVYTFGYDYFTPQLILNFCDGDRLFSTAQNRHFELDYTKYSLPALLVDIRFSPYSKRREWQTEYLQDMFRSRYLHIRAWGNRNYQSRDTSSIEIADFSAGVEQLNEARRLRQPILLMCQCPAYSQCHRSHIIRMLQERRPFIHTELGRW